MSALRPDQRQDWRFLMVLFSATTFLELMAWGHLMAFTPLYLGNALLVPPEEIPRWTGLLTSASLVIALPLSPFWGALADRYSRKAVMIRSLLVESVCFGLMAVCTDLTQLLAIRFLLGFSYGNIAVAMATQSVLTPDRKVGTAIGVIQTASTVAFAGGPLLGSLVINTLGVRTVFALDAVGTFGAALVILVAFREPSFHDRATPLLDKVKLVLQQVATVPPIRWNFLCWFLVFSGSGAMDPFLPVLAERLAGAADAATVVGLLLGGYGLLTGLVTPFAGRLADRVGAAQLFLFVAPMLALIAGGIGLAPTLPALAVLVILRALPQAGVAVVLYSHLATHVPAQHRGAVMSLTPMPRNAAWLVAPSLAAAASGLGLNAVFGVSTLLFACASLVAWLMVRSAPPTPLPPGGTSFFRPAGRGSHPPGRGG